MADDYQRQHYVPVWYQKRFIPDSYRDKELLYLDLRPETFRDLRGVVHHRNALRRLGPRHCFCQSDLYTHALGNVRNIDIEKFFFGAIDRDGQKAVEHFSCFDHTRPGTHDALQPMLVYLSTQKLRTPKGLSWLAEKTRASAKVDILDALVRSRQVFCAIWTESVWLIADASMSKTKFIMSDCPVTVYNCRCGPRSQWCRGHNDPDIWMNGTHTMFPLSPDKILILTNLSWVRNPYQNPVNLRPNPNPWRSAMFKIFDIQVERHLTEAEVRQINFIIKSRAYRYIAAAERDWLYPDQYVSKSDWAKYQHGYLFMPDPRSMTYSGEILMAYKDGTTDAFDEYGRKPWQPGYGKPPSGKGREIDAFYRFQGEFARLFGPYRRGRSFHMMHLDNELDEDGYHQYHLSLEERQTRRKKKK